MQGQTPHCMTTPTFHTDLRSHVVICSKICFKPSEDIPPLESFNAASNVVVRIFHGGIQAEAEDPGQKDKDAYRSSQAAQGTLVGDAGTKVCSKCRVAKLAADFFRDKSKPDGLYSQVQLFEAPAVFTYLDSATRLGAR